MSSTRGRWNTAVCSAITKNINNSEITEAIGKCQKLLFEEWQRQEVPKRPLPVKPSTQARRQQEMKRCATLFHALIQMAIEDDPDNEELQNNVLSIFMGMTPASAFPTLIQSVKWTNFTKSAKTALASAVPLMVETVFNADKEAKLENWFQLPVVPVLRIIYEYLEVVFKIGRAGAQIQVPRPAPQPVSGKMCWSYMVPAHKGTRMLISYKRKPFRKGGFLARIKREPIDNGYADGVALEELPPQPVAIPEGVNIPQPAQIVEGVARQFDIVRVKQEPPDEAPAPVDENPLAAEVAVPPGEEVRRVESVVPTVRVKLEVVEEAPVVDSGNASIAGPEEIGPSIQPPPANNIVRIDPQIRVKEEPVDEQPNPIPAEPHVPVLESGSGVAVVEEHAVPQPAPVNETPNLNISQDVVEDSQQPEGDEEGGSVDVQMENVEEPTPVEGEKETLSMAGDSDIILWENDVPAVQSTIVIDDGASISSSDISISSYNHILEELRLLDEDMVQLKQKASKTAGGGAEAEGGRQEGEALEEGECEVEEGEIELEEGEVESIDGIDCGGGAEKKGANGGKGKAIKKGGAKSKAKVLKTRPPAAEEQTTRAKKPAGDDFWETFACAAETYTPPPKRVLDGYLKRNAGKKKSLGKGKERTTKEQPLPASKAEGIQRNVKKHQSKDEKKRTVQDSRGAPEEGDRPLVENSTPAEGHNIAESPPYDEVYSEPPEPLPRDYPTREELEEPLPRDYPTRADEVEERTHLFDFSNCIDPFGGDGDKENGLEVDLVSSNSQEDDLMQEKTPNGQGDAQPVVGGNAPAEPIQPEVINAEEDDLLDFPLVNWLSKDRPRIAKRASRGPIREMVIKAQEKMEAAQTTKAKSATSSLEVHPHDEVVLDDRDSSGPDENSKNLGFTRVNLEAVSAKEIPQAKKRKISFDEEIVEVRRYSLRTPGGDAKRPRTSDSSISTRSLRRSTRNQSENTPTLRNSTASASQVCLALFIDPVLKPWTPPKIEVPYYFSETTSAWPSFNCSGVIYIVESEENMPEGVPLDDVPVAMIIVGGEKPKIKNIGKKMRPDVLLKFALEEFIKRFD